MEEQGKHNEEYFQLKRTHSVQTWPYFLLAAILSSNFSIRLVEDARKPPKMEGLDLHLIFSEGAVSCSIMSIRTGL